MKPSHTPDTTATLPMVFARRMAVASTSFAVGGAAHHFEQAHDIGGAEEMQPDHVLRAARETRDLIEIQRGSIGGEDRARPHHGVELLEYLALHVHVLEHGLDAQVHIAERGIVQGGCDQCQALARGWPR